MKQNYAVFQMDYRQGLIPMVMTYGQTEQQPGKAGLAPRGRNYFASPQFGASLGATYGYAQHTLISLVKSHCDLQLHKD